MKNDGVRFVPAETTDKRLLMLDRLMRYAHNTAVFHHYAALLNKRIREIAKES